MPLPSGSTKALPLFGLVILFSAGLFPLLAHSEEPHLSCGPDNQEGRSESSNGLQIWCDHQGSREGEYREYYPSGKIRIETRYENNQRNGPYRVYSESGEILSEGAYLNGKMSGRWVRRTETGALKDEGDWNQDAPIGIWRFYSETGALSEEGGFENGTRVCDWFRYPAEGGFEKSSQEKPTGQDCTALTIRPRFRFTRSRLDLFRFSLGLMSLQQESGGSSRTFLFGATPQGKLSSRFSWIAPIAFGFLPTRSPSTSWSLLSDFAFGLRFFTPAPEWLFLEAGTGVQTLLKSGTHLTTGFSIGYDTGLSGFLLKIQLKNVHDSENPRKEILVGAEFGMDALLGR